MKLSEYAKKVGISYKTSWDWFKKGLIEGAYKTESGSIFVEEKKELSETDERLKRIEGKLDAMLEIVKGNK